MSVSPVYLEIENYTDVLEKIDDLKQLLLRSHKILAELHDLRSEENRVIHDTQSSLSDMRTHFHIIHSEVQEK